MDFCHSRAEQGNVGVQPGHVCPQVHEDDSAKEVTSSFLPVQICSVLGLKSLPPIEDRQVVRMRHFSPCVHLKCGCKFLLPLLL